MSGTPPRIRRALGLDAAALAAFGAHTFADWYGPDNDPADMALHLERTYGVNRQRAEIDDPANVVLLAEDGTELAGYALLHAGPAHPSVTGPAPLEVRRFYVGRRWHGSGVAAALMDASAATARTLGAATLWLTAWERNPRALRFYGKHGFVAVGGATFVVGHSPQRDCVLSRVLAAS